jgi:hypothetical protein
VLQVIEKIIAENISEKNNSKKYIVKKAPQTD